LKKLPDPFEPNENDPSKMTSSDLEDLEDLVNSVKSGKSYLKHLHGKREFNNPENLNVIIFHFIFNSYHPYFIHLENH